MLSINAAAVANNQTLLQVNWGEISDQGYEGVSYTGVVIAEYASSKPLDLGKLPAAEQTQGNTTNPLSAGGGTTEFHNLKAATSYVFVLYGVADFSDGAIPVALAQSTPVSTAGTTSSKPLTPTGPEYPALSTQNLPKTLKDTNRIVVMCANASIYDHWIISVNGVQQSEQMVGDENFLIASGPGQAFTLNADGLLRTTTDYTGWGPPVPVKAGPNSNSVLEFLRNSGVTGSGVELRTLVKSSSSTGVRNMLGL
jgi:hypothetical protein